jgi:hypothetical protein
MEDPRDPVPPVAWSVTRLPTYDERALAEIDTAIALVQRGTAQIVLVSGIRRVETLTDEARTRANEAHVHLDIVPGPDDGAVHLVIGPREP